MESAVCCVPWSLSCILKVCLASDIFVRLTWFQFRFLFTEMMCHFFSLLLLLLLFTVSWRILLFHFDFVGTTTTLRSTFNNNHSALFSIRIHFAHRYSQLCIFNRVECSQKSFSFSFVFDFYFQSRLFSKSQRVGFWTATDVDVGQINLVSADAANALPPLPAEAFLIMAL